VVALDVLDRRVHGEPACKGNGKVVAQGAEFAALVGEVVDEFAVFAIFAREDFTEFEDGAGKQISVICCKRGRRGLVRIYCDGAVAFEDGGNGIEN